MTDYQVVGRRGHMGNGVVIDDEVVVKIVDGDVTAIGRGPSEAEAVTAGLDEIARFLEEQKVLNTPAVVAAREALAEAIRMAKEAHDRS